MAEVKTRWTLLLSMVAIIVAGALLFFVVAELLTGCSEMRVYRVDTMEDRMECG